MSDLSILVTGIGGDIGVNIVRCLKESSHKAKIYGCDADPYAFGKNKVIEFFQSPHAKREKEYFEFLKNVVRAKNIKYIYPAPEAEIEYFHQHRDIGKELNAEVMINNNMILDTFLDKYLTSEFLKTQGLPYARSFLMDQYRGELAYPLIIKKRRGSGSKLVLVVKNDEEFDFYKRKYANEDLIVQEYLGNPNEEYTLGVFSDGQRSYCIPFRRHLFSDVGVTRLAELVVNNKLEQLGHAVAKITKLAGSLNIQLRKDGDRYVPFEINPRVSGTAYVRHYFGFRDVEWWLDIKEKRQVQYVPKYRQGVAVRAISEVFYDVC